MSITYTPINDYAAKDGLPASDPNKVVRGTEFSEDFEAISDAFALAAPAANPTFTGTATFTTVAVSGTVDGRDVSVDGTKLDGIEALADVTDTANVTAAGALMDSELTNITAVKALNQGVATTDSPSFAGLTATTADINGGTIDGTVIGGTTAEAISGTTASFSGDLVVDTDTLFVDVSADRVGINRQPDSEVLELQAEAGTGGTEDCFAEFQLRSRIGYQGSRSGTPFVIDTHNGISARSLIVDTTAQGAANFVVASTGNVGIGTDSPAALLEVSDSADGEVARLRGPNSQLRVNALADGLLNLQNPSGTGALSFTMGSTERMRIDSSGNVGIGTDSPAYQLEVDGDIAAGNRYLCLDNGTAASPCITVGFDFDTGFYRAAVNTLGVTTGGTERMRLDSLGGLTVGHTGQITFNENVNTGTTIIGNGAITSFRDSASANFYVGKIGALNGDVLEFRRNGIDVGSISVTSGATAYNTSSDVRLKENIVDAPSASDDIDAIQIRSYDWKADGQHQKYGVVAQELVNVAPEAVSQGETEEDTWGVDYSKLVPMLVKEIQELRARVATLEGN